MLRLSFCVILLFASHTYAHHFPLDPPTPFPVKAVDAFPNLKFKRPVFLTSIPDGSHRLLVVEEDGYLKVLSNDRRTRSLKVFLDLHEAVIRNHEEEGLLGVAFDPDYLHNGFFYVDYVAPDPLRTVIARYHVSSDPNKADPESAKILLEIAQPFPNHKGGMLAFGPDRMLYIGMGDGGSGGDPYGNGQNKNVLLGKILRIDPSGAPYAIPRDNPFAKEAGAKPEIWAYGLRNPWRFSFDRETGDLWAGDVGQNRYEEIDIIKRGGNYGWNECEGFHRYEERGACPREFLAPVIEYDHGVGQSVTGGYVYRGTKLPSLRGAYLYGDYVSRKVWALVYTDGKVASNTLITELPQGLSSFGEDENGEIFALAFGPRYGKIYRFEEQSGHPTPPVFPTQLSETGLFSSTAALTPEPELLPYEVNLPLWSDGAGKDRWIDLPAGGKISFDPTGAWQFPKGTAFVKEFELSEGNETRRLETRVFLLQNDGWHGYTYKWNDAQTDAVLLGDALTETVTVGGKAHTWTYPSRSDCLRCHTPAAGFVLGARTRQWNRALSSGENLLDRFNHAGLFGHDIGKASQYSAYSALSDASASVEQRARGYLAVNCAVCHVPGGTAPTAIDLAYDTPLDQTHTVGETPIETLGFSPSAIIAPGHKEQSILWQRMGRRDQDAMPPLATHVPDEAAVKLIGDWIDAMTVH